MKSTGAGFTRDAVNTVGEKVARVVKRDFAGALVSFSDQ